MCFIMTIKALDNLDIKKAYTLARNLECEHLETPQECIYSIYAHMCQMRRVDWRKHERRDGACWNHKEDQRIQLTNNLTVTPPYSSYYQILGVDMKVFMYIICIM
jgi:hypothetical protein